MDKLEELEKRIERLEKNLLDLKQDLSKVKIQKDDENRIWVSDDRKTIIQLFIPMFEFKGIKEMKMYYLEDL